MSDLTKLIYLSTFTLFAGFSFSHSQVLNSNEISKNNEINLALADNSDSKDISVFKITKTESPSGAKAPDFTWEENGKQVKFSEFTKGKIVFLNFWATWCGPCKKEIPDIIEISKEMSDKNVVVIGIALAYNWEKAAVDKGFNETLKYAKDKSIPYKLLYGIPEIQRTYGGIQSIPTSFFINEKGEIVNTIVGSRSKEDFMKEINKIIKK